MPGESEDPDGPDGDRDGSGEDEESGVSTVLDSIGVTSPTGRGATVSDTDGPGTLLDVSVAGSLRPLGVGDFGGTLSTEFATAGGDVALRHRQRQPRMVVRRPPRRGQDAGDADRSPDRTRQSGETVVDRTEERTVERTEQRTVDRTEERTVVDRTVERPRIVRRTVHRPTIVHRETPTRTGDTGDPGRPPADASAGVPDSADGDPATTVVDRAVERSTVQPRSTDVRRILRRTGPGSVADPGTTGPQDASAGVDLDPGMGTSVLRKRELSPTVAAPGTGSGTGSTGSASDAGGRTGGTPSGPGGTPGRSVRMQLREPPEPGTPGEETGPPGRRSRADPDPDPGTGSTDAPTDVAPGRESTGVESPATGDRTGDASGRQASTGPGRIERLVADPETGPAPAPDPGRGAGSREDFDPGAGSRESGPNTSGRPGSAVDRTDAPAIGRSDAPGTDRPAASGTGDRASRSGSPVAGGRSPPWSGDGPTTGGSPVPGGLDPDDGGADDAGQAPADRQVHRDLPVLRMRSPGSPGSPEGSSRTSPGGRTTSGRSPEAPTAPGDSPEPSPPDLDRSTAGDSPTRPETAPERPGEAAGRDSDRAGRASAGSAVRPERPGSTDRSPTTTATPASDRSDDGGIRIRNRPPGGDGEPGPGGVVDRSADVGTARSSGDATTVEPPQGEPTTGSSGSPSGTLPASADRVVRERRDVSVLGIGPADRPTPGGPDRTADSAGSGGAPAGRGSTRRDLPTLRTPSLPQRPDSPGTTPGGGRDRTTGGADEGTGPGGTTDPADAGSPEVTGDAGTVDPPSRSGGADDAGTGPSPADTGGIRLGHDPGSVAPDSGGAGGSGTPVDRRPDPGSGADSDVEAPTDAGSAGSDRPVPVARSEAAASPGEADAAGDRTPGRSFPSTTPVAGRSAGGGRTGRDVSVLGLGSGSAPTGGRAGPSTDRTAAGDAAAPDRAGLHRDLPSLRMPSPGTPDPTDQGGRPGRERSRPGAPDSPAPSPPQSSEGSVEPTPTDRPAPADDRGTRESTATGPGPAETGGIRLQSDAVPVDRSPSGPVEGGAPARDVAGGDPADGGAGAGSDSPGQLPGAGSAETDAGAAGAGSGRAGRGSVQAPRDVSVLLSSPSAASPTPDRAGGSDPGRGARGSASTPASRGRWNPTAARRSGTGTGAAGSSAAGPGRRGIARRSPRSVDRVFRQPQAPPAPARDRPESGAPSSGVGDGQSVVGDAAGRDRAPEGIPGEGAGAGQSPPSTSGSIPDLSVDTGGLDAGSTGAGPGTSPPADPGGTGPGTTTLDRLVAGRGYTTDVGSGAGDGSAGVGPGGAPSGPGGSPSGTGPGTPGVRTSLGGAGGPGRSPGRTASPGSVRRTFAAPSLDRVVVDRAYDRLPTERPDAGTDRTPAQSGDPEAPAPDDARTAVDRSVGGPGGAAPTDRQSGDGAGGPTSGPGSIGVLGGRDGPGQSRSVRTTLRRPPTPSADPGAPGAGDASGASDGRASAPGASGAAGSGSDAGAGSSPPTLVDRRRESAGSTGGTGPGGTGAGGPGRGTPSRRTAGTGPRLVQRSPARRETVVVDEGAADRSRPADGAAPDAGGDRGTAGGDGGMSVTDAGASISRLATGHGDLSDGTVSRLVQSGADGAGSGGPGPVPTVLATGAGGSAAGPQGASGPTPEGSAPATGGPGGESPGEQPVERSTPSSHVPQDPTGTLSDMPSLTLQRGASDVGTGEQSGGSGVDAGPSGPDGAPSGPGPVSGLGDSYPEFSFDRGSSGEDAGTSTEDGDGSAGGSDGGPDGSGASGQAAGGTPDPGPGTGTRSSGDAVSPGVEELLSPEGPELLAYDADVDRVVERLYRELERKMRIERERRGL